MGISLNGLTPANTYQSLIKVGDNSQLTETLKTLSDGFGTDLPMQVSTSGVNFTGTLTQNGLPVTTPPSGVSGAIQFSDGSAFASDANLFWDNTNKRLGVGTNTPTGRIGVGNDDGLYFGSRGYISGNTSLNGIYLRSGSGIFGVGASGNEYTMTVGGGLVGIGISTATPTARLQVRGSGSTSATTALLVQNSAGNDTFKVRDDGTIFMGIGTGSSLICDAGGPDKIRTSSVGVGVEGLPVTSAALAVNGTTKGFLPPRMTTTQKNAIATPASGLQVYDTTLNQMSYYNGTSWVNF